MKTCPDSCRGICLFQRLFEFCHIHYCFGDSGLFYGTGHEMAFHAAGDGASGISSLLKKAGAEILHDSVITAAMEQWLTVDHLKDVGDALDLVENHSLTNLQMRNFLWMGKTILLNMKNLESDTLPGYATYIGDVSYYVLYRQDVADLINDRYNPYRETILAENLKIAG